MAIICGTDFSEESRRALEAAVSLAGTRGEEVVLVHAMELPTVAFIAGEGIVMPPAVPPPTLEAMRDELDKKLADDARRAGANVRPVLSIGAPELALLDEATRYAARLIVVASHGHRSRATRWLLGSTADRLARSSPLPLLVVRGEAKGFVDFTTTSRPMKVLVAVDFNEGTDHVIEAALLLCSAGMCALHFAHAFETPTPISPFVTRLPATAHPATQYAELERLVQDELARLAEKTQGTNAGPAPSDRIHLLHGRPAVEITRFAREEGFDLVVVGTHSRRGLERLLLGSVATGILHRAPCPVLVAPVPEHVETHATPPAP